MRHLKAGRKLSRRREHRVAMLANLAASLVKNGSVRTTDAKAKEVRSFVERMVTFAKRGDLHARRIVLSRLHDDVAVKKLFDEYGPKFANRLGGYTRVLKLGFRLGDNSPISILEFVDEDRSKRLAAKPKSDAKKSKKTTEEASEEKTEDVKGAKKAKPAAAAEKKPKVTKKVKAPAKADEAAKDGE